jgi:hypothetical protein
MKQKNSDVQVEDRCAWTRQLKALMNSLQLEVPPEQQK